MAWFILRSAALGAFPGSAAAPSAAARQWRCSTSVARGGARQGDRQKGWGLATVDDVFKLLTMIYSYDSVMIFKLIFPTTWFSFLHLWSFNGLPRKNRNGQCESLDIFWLGRFFGWLGTSNQQELWMIRGDFIRLVLLLSGPAWVLMIFGVTIDQPPNERISCLRIYDVVNTMGNSKAWHLPENYTWLEGRILVTMLDVKRLQ